MIRHQYLERETLRVCDEKFYWDGLIRFLYSEVREHAPSLFRAATTARTSSLLSFLSYDFFLTRKLSGMATFLRSSGIDLKECLDPTESLDTPKKIFQRKIRYWECRPMPEHPDTVVSPADARMFVGSFSASSTLFVKGKFFDYDELLGPDRCKWLNAFRNGDFAVFRLSPDRYHYNHLPVSGVVADFYEIAGLYHSCNPYALVHVAGPYSKNRRIITVIDTDVHGGSNIGLVAMIEVVALMIGQVQQCYSEVRYEEPCAIVPGMYLKKGSPKSLYLPGSSTDVLIFQQERVSFLPDIVRNMQRPDVRSRVTVAAGRPFVETDVKVRSAIASPAMAKHAEETAESFLRVPNEEGMHNDKEGATCRVIPYSF